MDDTYEERPPLTLLADALALCEMASELPPSPHSHHASAARSAVMSGILALEATANCLIGAIEFPPRLMGLIDQASPVEKFEFALFARNPGKAFDRGAKHVQVLKELFEIRNRFVHPKPQEHGISHRDLGGGTIQVEKTGPPTQQLKLPASPEDWRSDHAVRVIGSVFAFLDYFLIDLCEWSKDDIATLLLSRLVIDGAPKVLLPGPQVAVFFRAERRGLQSRALRAVLRPSEEQEETATELLVKYSWSRGPVQRHDQRQTVVVHDRPRLVDAVIGAAQKFILWFASAQHQLRGRDLVLFDILSADEQHRYAQYRIFIPLHSGPTTPPESRPIGRVAGVSRHIFANGIAAPENAGDTWRLTLVEDSGAGRTISFPRSQTDVLRQLILSNSRGHWVPAAQVARPAHVDTKGKDFLVASVEIVAYDPTSETGLICYTSEAGNLVQINLSTSNLMALLAQLP